MACLGCVVLALPSPPAGAEDAGGADAGALVDAATPDAATPDAATPDAGIPDAAAPDAPPPLRALADTSWRRSAGKVGVSVGASLLIAGGMVFAARFLDDRKTRDAVSSSGVLPVLLLGGAAAAGVGSILWLTAPSAPAGLALAPGMALLTVSARF